MCGGFRPLRAAGEPHQGAARARHAQPDDHQPTTPAWTTSASGCSFRAKQVAHFIGSYVGENREFERQAIAGEIKYTLVPQGTLAERIRAAGAGIGGFFTPTGLRDDGGRGEGDARHRRAPLHPRGAAPRRFRVRSRHTGDTKGNLIYRKTARNFNPCMATGAKVTFAEVEEIVEPGRLEPDAVVTPGIFVTHVLKGAYYEKRIERRTVRQLQAV